MTDDKGGSQQITRAYEIMSAPTGEGTRYETDALETWRDCQPFETPAGQIIGDRIEPFPR